MEMIGKDSLELDLNCRIEKDDRMIDISDLVPGSCYRINATMTDDRISSGSLRPIFSTRRCSRSSNRPRKPPRPGVVGFSNTTVKLKLRISDQGNRKRSVNSESEKGMYMIVVERLGWDDKSELEKILEKDKGMIFDDLVTTFDRVLPDFDHSRKKKLKFYVTALFERMPPEGLFVVGDGKEYSGSEDEHYFNAPLTPNNTYLLWFGVGLSLDGARIFAFSSTFPPVTTSLFHFRSAESALSDIEAVIMPAGTIAALVLAIILCVLIIISVSTLFYLRKKRKATSVPPPPTIQGGQISLLNDKTGVSFAPEPLPPLPPPPNFKSTNTFDASYYVMKSTHPVSIRKLRYHYENGLRPNAHYGLADEYRHLPEGFTDTTCVANLPYNFVFNRTQRAIPYDKNRVTLCETSNVRQHVHQCKLRSYDRISNLRCHAASLAEYCQRVLEDGLGYKSDDYRGIDGGSERIGLFGSRSILARCWRQVEILQRRLRRVVKRGQDGAFREKRIEDKSNRGGIGGPPRHPVAV